MRYLLTCCAILFLCLHAQAFQSIKNYRSYALGQMIHGQLNVTLELLEDEDEPLRAQYEQDIASVISQWFTRTAQLIASAKRTEEFEDIYPILKRGVHVSFSPETANGKSVRIRILSKRDIQDEFDGQNPLAATDCDSTNIEITIRHYKTLKPSQWKRVLLHEFGHVWGLADVYQPRLKLAQKNGDLSAACHSLNQPKSLMKQNGNDLSCDDADGLINLIDQYRKGAGGKRAGKPWQSLCNTSDWYQDGKSVSSVSAQQIQKQLSALLKSTK